MATNFLSLRSSAAPSISAVNLTISTLTGSTVSGSTITALSNANMKSIAYSTLQGSSITTSTIAISSLLQISSSGLLGIGTNPTQALHVQGSTIVSGAIGIGSTAPTDILNLGSGNIVLNNNAAQASGFMYNQNSIWGGVEVEGLAGTGAQTINMGVNTNRTKAWSSTYNGLWLRVDNRTATTYNGFHFFNKAATSGTESELMTILSSGSVGIGSSSPGAQLQVTNNAVSYTIPTVSISDGTADNVGTYGMINLTRPVAPGDNKGHIALISSGNRVGLLGYINNTPTMGWVSANSMNTSNGIFLNSSGNVSVGTTASTAKLTISGTLGGEIAHLLSGSGGANMWFGTLGSTRNAGTILWRQIGSGSTANYLGIGAHGVDDILNVAASGQVGIGITNPAQTLDVYGTIARNGLKLPRFDYGTVGPATSVSIPILFSDTQYNVVEIRFRYEVSAITDINMSATSTTPATMTLGEVGLTTVKYNAQSAPDYNSSASTTSFIFAKTVEMVGTGGNLMFRIVRSIGVGNAGQRNHYCYDNVYCWSSVGTARGYGQGHIDNTGVGGPALAYLNLICVSGNINGTWSTTHYN